MDSDSRLDVQGEGIPEVLVQKDGPIATITINRPRKLNTLTHPLVIDLTKTIRQVDKDEGVRLIVPTAAGDRAFIGGVDVSVFIPLDPAGAERFITDLHDCCLAIREADKIVIAAINGHALGGGLEVAASCDLRISSDRACFGMPEVKVGLPSVIEAAYLPRLIGLGRTQDLVYLGDMIDAQEACRIGLVNKVVPHEELKGATHAMAQKALANGPMAMKLQKKLVAKWIELPFEASIKAGIRAFHDCFETDQPREGATAFLEKRKPSYRSKA